MSQADALDTDSLALAARAAREAGALMLSERARLSPEDIEEKGPNDFVTRIDHLLEDLIRDRIRKSFPHDSFLAEEGGIQGSGSSRLWIVDPLDGTTNYIRGLPFFSVSIAMAVDGRIALCAIYDPVHDELFEALRGRGSSLNGRGVKASASSGIAGAMLGTGLPSRFKEALPGYVVQLAAVMRQAGGLRRLGSAALGLAYVACGRLDGFWEPRLGPWDMAAGSLLVEEAGGRILGHDGSAWNLESRGIVAATSGILKELTGVLGLPN